MLIHKRILLNILDSALLVKLCEK